MIFEWNQEAKLFLVEVEFLNVVFDKVQSMADFCKKLRREYCMNESSFTEADYHQTVEDMLFNCPQVSKVRLNLPFQLVGRHCNSATIILANTFKALAARFDEDSAPLRTLVIENVTDTAIRHLWTNPIDVMNIVNVTFGVENLVMTIRRHELETQRSEIFGLHLWNLIQSDKNLRSLCLVASDHDDKPPRGLKETKYWQYELAEWRAKSLPPPHAHIKISNLTCLELKRVEISPESFQRFVDGLGSTLEELYLNEVYLKTERSREWNEDSTRTLWVGIPNQTPSEGSMWAAMALKAAAPHLRICRAAFLGYDHYLREDLPGHPSFDLIDPCGLGRSLSQRFVEVVSGIRQPNTADGQVVEYFPRDSIPGFLGGELKARTRALKAVEYDTNAYQAVVANPTSCWQKSIDGTFPNLNANTLDELHYIAETACQGMNEIHNRRCEWTAGSSLANEYTDNMSNAPNDDDANDNGPEGI